MKRDVWFVTGASSGFGLCTVKALLSDGRKVAATTRSVSRLLEAVGGANDSLLPLEVDLTSEASIQAAVAKTVATFGCIDVVVNNAGYALAGAVEEVSTEEAKKLFDIDFFAVHTVMRCVLPQMRAQRSGYIINVSSIAASHARPGLALYGAAKAAVVGMTTAFVDETAEFGIKATCVCPGPFATNIQKQGTPRSAASIDDYQRVHQLLDQTVHVKFPGDPEKAAKVFLLLAATENPPVILYLGPNAFARAKAHHTAILNDLQEWEKVICGTDL